MKKLFLILANKLEPSIIKNILLRLATKTPKMFKLLQLYCGGISMVLAAIIEALSNHQIPDFKYENIVIAILQFAAVLIAGIGVSMSLHTDDKEVHNESVTLKQ